MGFNLAFKGLMCGNVVLEQHQVIRYVRQSHNCASDVI